MEFIVGFLLIAVLMLCLGFGLGDIALLALAILGIGIVLIGLFFAFCLVLLSISKRKTAVFSEINEEPRFPVAVYDIDGEKVQNLFPCEMIMRDKLYVENKKIRLLYCGLRKAAIDRNALLTIIAGSIIFIPSAVFVVLKMIELFLR